MPIPALTPSFFMSPLSSKISPKMWWHVQVSNTSSRIAWIHHCDDAWAGNA